MDFPSFEDRVFCNDAPADADLFLSARARFARRSEDTFLENMLTATDFATMTMFNSLEYQNTCFNYIAKYEVMSKAI